MLFNIICIITVWINILNRNEKAPQYFGTLFYGAERAFEYAEYKKLCEERGEKPKYSNLGAFRRAYRSEEGSLAYAKSHYAHRDARRYEEFERVIVKENMPKSLAKYQEMKYNKNKKKYVELQKFKEYRKENPQSTKENFLTAQRLKESGVKGEIRIPPQKVET